MLSSRMDNPLHKFAGLSQSLGEDDHTDNQDISFVESIKIPYIKRLPPTIAKPVNGCHNGRADWWDLYFKGIEMFAKNKMEGLKLRIW